MDATDGNAEEQGYTLLPLIMFDASTLSAGAHCLYTYLCYLAGKRGTRSLAGNVIEEYVNRHAEEVRPQYSPDLCFDALYELTFPRTELGGRSYVSIEVPLYLTDFRGGRVQPRPREAGHPPERHQRGQRAPRPVAGRTG